ncbi:glycosyltransferase family 2 protein [Corynebacterium sp. ES2730-CONJ]|uniref:glycosyltransferase n=1 Tax=Corynebacterium sp. ES2730-CONJ TaxID=2973941 RepID=UPI00216B5896|nr:glycosyltransferase family 2 protein [Corynebacterium sp. ES2730-CONJ]MCS4532466.1 glycosyltransferase family 2 protein [Corynebacterium sp. ES2730-CONJ]
MHSRRISMIIPCLNDAPLLARLLESLSDQTIPADEVIVIDNGSEDHSAEVAEKLGARVVSEPHRGITRAVWAGFEASTGDIMVRTDADAVLPRDYIAKLHTTFDRADKNPGLRVVGITGNARFQLPSPWSRIASKLYVGSYLSTTASALGHYPFYGTNFAIRRSWWEEVRDQVDFTDTFVHEDLNLSFAVRPHETVWYQDDLLVEMDPRALFGARQLFIRFTRGFYTMFKNFRTQPPPLRLSHRGVLGSTMQKLVSGREK